MSQESERELIESGIEAMTQKDHEKSLELLVRAKSLALQNENYEDLFLALNNIGANYYSMLDYGEALSNYIEAYDIAINHLQPTYEISVLNNIAILYSKEKNFDKAEENFRKAYNTANDNKELIKKGLYAINLGAVLNEKNDLTTAQEFLKEAIQIFENDPKMLLEANLILSNNYMLGGRYKESIKLSFQLESQFFTEEYKEHKVSNYLIISKSYQKQGDFKKAMFYANKALEGRLNIENKINVYEHLSDLHIEQSDFKSALSIKDTLLIAQNRLNNIKNGRLFESNKVKFEIQNYQKELLYQQEKIKDQGKQFYILLFASFFIVVIIGWALRNSFMKSRQKKILHEKTEELTNLELDKEKTEKILLEKQLKEKETLSLLQQEKLKNEIDFKNRKLSSKALYLSDRNNLINNIIEDLDRIYHVRRDPELKSHIQNLKGLLKTENEWESFIKHFEEVNHGFINKLKTEYSLLNTNDIRFLSYIYMNLSVKEISHIFNITPEACRKRKERVSKKLGLHHGSQLYDHLYKIN
ncbi:MAG: tetratricopeptide repeat protein [Psychroserpens sp.]|uniref:tetratricopeptide repeat protein n=1 Tax=Psychroserpens sp. TaxID=2020870 RepID=UPI0030026257